MKLVTAIVRPEKVMNVIKALEEEGCGWKQLCDSEGDEKAACA